MIHVDRSPPPRVLQGPGSPADQERQLAEAFYSGQHTRRGQQRFEFKAYRDRAVIEALSTLFHRKCAYCEANISAVAPLDVEQYRPKSGVVESPDHPGYWWLASDWTNLLASCMDCNRTRAHEGVRSGKANRFPLEDEKMRVFTPMDDLGREMPLILNPCVDFPEEHLVFDDEGTVASETTRGQATIAVLGLNRPGLVESRRATAQRARFSLSNLERALRYNKGGLAFSEADIREMVANLVAMTEASAEFAGMNRQIIRAELDKLSAKYQLSTPKMVKPEIAGSSAPARSKADIRKAQTAFKAFEEAQSDFSLGNVEGQRKYRSQRRHIEKVTLKNFKGIESLELTLGGGAAGSSWLMLLGENSTGKSSVLQAIALTLAGANYFAEVMHQRGGKLRDLIHYDTPEAEITVTVSGFVGSHKLMIKPGMATFQHPNGAVATVKPGKRNWKVISANTRSAESQIVIIAYGATRLLPRTPVERYGIKFARIDNLFDPFLPLFDADKWLRSLKGQSFDDVAIVLKDLLALKEDAEVVRRGRKLVVRLNGDDVPLSQLSDGYQAVIAMTVDILEVAKRLWSNVMEAEGVVLLDEIGSHLHPVWKMQIVESLRRAFPGMQFVATTHEPLCLRGLGKGEAVVMRRDENNRVEAVSELPAPSDFRVDQLLTSEFFGLNSTIDMATEKLFDEYYALLALTKTTAEQRQRLEQLRGDLADRRYMGSTLREQLMYEAIDRLVAQQKLNARPIPELKNDVVAELERIWNSPAEPATGSS